MEVRHPAERLLGLFDDEDERRDGHADDHPGDQSSDHAEDDAKSDPAGKVTLREQRLLAERIADLWCVPYREPEFARLARAEHKRLKEQDGE